MATGHGNRELGVKPKHLKLLQQAQALDRAGKALEASVAYQAFLTKEPKHADAWADCAGQLLKLGKLEEAKKACETDLMRPRINSGLFCC